MNKPDREFATGQDRSAFTADDYNQLAEYIESMANLKVEPPLHLNQSASGLSLRLDQKRGFWAKVTGDGNPYGFTQQFIGPDRAFADDPNGYTGVTSPGVGDFSAYEVNGVENLDGTYQWLLPGWTDDFRFQDIAKGGGCPPILVAEYVECVGAIPVNDERTGHGPVRICVTHDGVTTCYDPPGSTFPVTGPGDYVVDLTSDDPDYADRSYTYHVDEHCVVTGGPDLSANDPDAQYNLAWDTSFLAGTQYENCATSDPNVQKAFENGRCCCLGAGKLPDTIYASISGPQGTYEQYYYPPLVFHFQEPTLDAMKFYYLPIFGENSCYPAPRKYYMTDEMTFTQRSEIFTPGDIFCPDSGGYDESTITVRFILTCGLVNDHEFFAIRRVLTHYRRTIVDDYLTPPPPNCPAFAEPITVIDVDFFPGSMDGFEYRFGLHGTCIPFFAQTDENASYAGTGWSYVLTE